MSVFNIINETKLIPLTTITSREDVEPLCEVLTEASIPIIEITLRDERTLDTVSYTHLRAHETLMNLVCRLLLEKKKKNTHKI